MINTQNALETIKNNGYFEECSHCDGSGKVRGEK